MDLIEAIDQLIMLRIDLKFLIMHETASSINETKIADKKHSIEKLKDEIKNLILHRRF